MKLQVLSGREASMFACLTDTVVAPRPVLPPVTETSAVEFFDRWLARSPRLNRIGLRVLLHAAELAPLAAGAGQRMRRLSEAERAATLERLDRTRSPHVGQVVKLLKGVACLAYYGDDDVMRGLGYDPDAVVTRGRELRAEESRP